MARKKNTRCAVRFYIQRRGERMLTPVGKAAAQRMAGVRAMDTAHAAACKKGSGMAKCRKSGPCAKVYADRLR